MDRDQFWRLVDEARAGSNGDGHALVARLQAALEVLPQQGIIDFDRVFDQLMRETYTWELWGAAYIVNGGCSDDGFDFFRGWLVAQGERVLRAALADADSLVDVVTAKGTAELEAMTVVADKAYRAKTGKSMPPTTVGSVPREPLGEKWEEDELEELFPKLAAKFGA